MAARVSDLKWIKRCFGCNRLKPLIWFKINPRKYQLKSDKGRAVDCRLCAVRRLIKQKGEIIKYNPSINRYDTINLKINLWNILKTYFINSKNEHAQKI